MNLTHNPSPEALLIESRITLIKFKAALNSLNGKTPGLDRITYPMIKNLCQPLTSRLINLYNNILDSHIPQQFKNSIIIPIHKPNTPKTSLTSYRPISLNPCLSKVLDKIIANRLWWLALNCKLLDSRQLGFRKGMSVSECLTLLDYQTTAALSTRSHLSIISLDFEKAFDKIGIHAIIDDLQRWKIGPKLLNFVKNFLTNRKIKV